MPSTPKYEAVRTMLIATGLPQREADQLLDEMLAETLNVAVLAIADIYEERPAKTYTGAEVAQRLWVARAGMVSGLAARTQR